MSGIDTVGLVYKGYTATTTLDRSFGVVVVCQILFVERGFKGYHRKEVLFNLTGGCRVYRQSLDVSKRIALNRASRDQYRGNTP